MAYLTLRDYFHLWRAKTFEDLSQVSFRVLKRMPKPVGEVCGPITSGGAGSRKRNLENFRKAIRKLKKQGINIFDQMPFERHMLRILKSPYYKGNDHLLETFYRPIFESGLVTTLYFISGWESSYGARWEHAEALRLGINIVYL